MKIKTSSALIVLLFITCSKENYTGKLQTASSSNLIALDTAKIPLNDLGTGTYLGYMGGLYPGGANVPSGQYAADLLEVSNSIVPIDKSGIPSNTSTGKIVFISLGASVGGHMMKALIPKTTNSPATNPTLLLLNCNQGGNFASLSNLMNPNDTYWARVDRTITRKTSYNQVQVIYLETDGTAPVSFPGKPTCCQRSN